MKNNVMKNGEILTDEMIDKIILEFDEAIKKKKLKIVDHNPLKKKPLAVSQTRLPEYVKRELGLI